LKIIDKVGSGGHERKKPGFGDGEKPIAGKERINLAKLDSSEDSPPRKPPPGAGEEERMLALGAGIYPFA
jgi:hypothetical protein